ncbi:MAG: DUF424 domain-containing protein [Thermoplasmatota archaeon]
MEISYNIYKQGEDVLLAACDSELLGKKFCEGEITLDVKESFYSGKEGTPSELCKNFKEATIANLIGEKTIDTAISDGFGGEEDILWVDGIPHLQIVRM